MKAPIHFFFIFQIGFFLFNQPLWSSENEGVLMLIGRLEADTFADIANISLTEQDFNLVGDSQIANKTGTTLDFSDNSGTGTYKIQGKLSTAAPSNWTFKPALHLTEGTPVTPAPALTTSYQDYMTAIPNNTTSSGSQDLEVICSDLTSFSTQSIDIDWFVTAE